MPGSDFANAEILHWLHRLIVLEGRGAWSWVHTLTTTNDFINTCTATDPPRRHQAAAQLTTLSSPRGSCCTQNQLGPAETLPASTFNSDPPEPATHRPQQYSCIRNFIIDTTLLEHWNRLGRRGRCTELNLAILVRTQPRRFRNDAGPLEDRHIILAQGILEREWATSSSHFGRS